jgi:RNA polymerase sigma-70 factor (ECF subfamily)
VVQETWIVAVRRIAAFYPMQAAFATWLRGIAAHILRNHFRNMKRHGRLAVSRNGVSSDAEHRDRAERVARALSRLPERYEAVLRAKYLDSQSVADVAAAWNETPKAVESLLTRARQAFREKYDESD